MIRPRLIYIYSEALADYACWHNLIILELVESTEHYAGITELLMSITDYTFTIEHNLHI